MKLLGLILGLVLGQDCPFYAEGTSGSYKVYRRNAGKSGPTLLFDEAVGAILSTGSGNLEIKDLRGQFWESDFTRQKESHVITSTEYKRNSLQINFGENIHLSLNCLDTSAQLVQLAVENGMDRFWLRFAAGSAEEGVYGGGEQFSYFNLRGKSFQMLTREQGVGRNASELVSFVSERCCRTGGEYHHTYWPQPTCVISGSRLSSPPPPSGLRCCVNRTIIPEPVQSHFFQKNYAIALFI
ncbi:Oidioi.mRNA.OKI2018_I69.PAR.g9884.t1.cds [Oikopleura dioica]|uniref:Oidioi.mRNA.OKI2018_I69.PAR.g9884.t1.cds n=1 Tax=Oikopleura dioica TaxID=34765 RepID=A0ABN7RVF9_OIKDI|nr:Oidioi.mRNA.OKI2018_I69.PAR.g9884.t1.cds [Oikopleura dioica]